VCGAKWIFGVLKNTVKALKARQASKEMYRHATR